MLYNKYVQKYLQVDYMTPTDPLSPKDPVSKIRQKEPELPDTTYSSDIENKVFQGIILNTLSTIEGVHLIDDSFLHSLIGKVDKIKGIHVDQDPANHSVKLQVEINVQYGISIPEKAEEIQNNISREVTKMTGVHVSEIHVIFRELVTPESQNEKATTSSTLRELERSMQKELEDEF